MSFKQKCMARNTLLFVVLMIGLNFAGGCTIAVPITYSPLAATESLASSTGELKVFVTRFDDARDVKKTKHNVIGRMNNSLGGKEKTLVTTDDLGRVLGEATTDALRKAGLIAELHGERNTGEQIPSQEFAGYDLVVGGKITDVQVVTQPGWDTIKSTAKIVVSMHVRNGSNGGEWVGPIEGTSEVSEFGYINSNTISQTLDNAIQVCMRNMVRHLKSSGAIVAN